MHEAGEPTLLVCANDVRIVERRLAIRAAVFAGDERQNELVCADYPDVAEVAAKLLGVLEDVGFGRQWARLSGQVAPSPHQARAIHVDQRVRHVQILGDELAVERFVRETEALMQVCLLYTSDAADERSSVD